MHKSYMYLYMCICDSQLSGVSARKRLVFSISLLLILRLTACNVCQNYQRIKASVWSFDVFGCKDGPEAPARVSGAAPCPSVSPLSPPSPWEPESGPVFSSSLWLFPTLDLHFLHRTLLWNKSEEWLIIKEQTAGLSCIMLVYHHVLRDKNVYQKKRVISTLKKIWCRNNFQSES